MSIKAVSLFSGAGGFCEGVRLAGWKVLCAVEADPSACLTHERNFSDVSLYAGDIRDFLRIERDGVPSLGDLKKEEVDIVFGGPPCQGFSQIGPRVVGDPRNQLYRHFVRVVKALKPRAFIMENVPNMLSIHGGRYRSRIVAAFKAAGYSRVSILDARASDFGVPQHRQRVFIIGIRDNEKLAGDLSAALSMRLNRQKTSRPVTVREALSDLPAKVSLDDEPLPYPRKRGGRYFDYQKRMRLDTDAPMLPGHCGRASDPPLLHNHHTKGIEKRRSRIVAAIRPGARGDSLPEHLWSGTRAHKWRRLHPDKPSYTILAQMHRDLSEWIHPVHNRWITVREAARLQSFHDGFVFCGSEWQQLKQVGNAVPPLMAMAIARTAAGVLKASDRRKTRRRNGHT